jgi:4-hydroxybenzoate polyprenyltransferase
VISTNVVTALLCFWLAGDRGVDALGFSIAAGLIACLFFGIVLELRGSRWSSWWNVSLFAAVSLAAFVAAALTSHEPSETAGWLVVFVGVPALFLSVIDFFAYRRERRLKAA